MRKASPIAFVPDAQAFDRPRQMPRLPSTCAEKVAAALTVDPGIRNGDMRGDRPGFPPQRTLTISLSRDEIPPRLEPMISPASRKYGEKICSSWDDARSGRRR